MGEWHRKSVEADKYDTAMWQRFLSEMVNTTLSTDAQRQGFRDGFNGEPRPHHYAVRGAFDRGRHAAILLGYIEP